MDMSWDSNHSTTLRGMLMAIAASGSCSHIRGTDNAPQLTTTRGCHLLPPTNVNPLATSNIKWLPNKPIIIHS